MAGGIDRVGVCGGQIREMRGNLPPKRLRARLSLANSISGTPHGAGRPQIQARDPNTSFFGAANVMRCGRQISESGTFQALVPHLAPKSRTWFSSTDTARPETLAGRPVLPPSSS